jgi:hypothetical protein
LKKGYCTIRNIICEKRSFNILTSYFFWNPLIVKSVWDITQHVNLIIFINTAPVCYRRGWHAWLQHTMSAMKFLDTVHCFYVSSSLLFSQDSFIWDFLLYLEDILSSNFISICTPVLHRELVDRYGISISQIMAIDIFLYIHFFFPPSLTILLPDFTMTD